MGSVPFLDTDLQRGEQNTPEDRGSTPLVRLDSLTKRYPSVVALDDLSLVVPHGVVGLVGTNGAGKSTLIKLLLGLVAPTSGTAEVLGLDATADGRRVRERIGYMPEHDCLPTDISATEFVIHMARMSGLPPKAARERTAEMLRHVGLFEERYRPIGGYSTGMKQRVKLAQALVHDPELLFLDEPTNGLDPNGRDDMLGLIRRTGSEFGISVIMSSHLLTEIESVCDALVVIDAGRLIRAGEMADFISHRNVLAIETEHSQELLLDRLCELGFVAWPEGRGIMMELEDAESASARRAALHVVAELQLPLVRLGRRRHTLGELFQGPASAPRNGEA